MNADTRGSNGERTGISMNKPGDMTKRSGRIPSRTSKGSADVPDRLGHLDRTQRHAVLATTGRTGPLASLVAFVLTKDGRGIVFATPTVTTKYRNIIRDSRVSLLIDSRKNSGSDYLKAEAMSVFGRAAEVREGPEWAALATLLASKHKELGSFIAAPSTALMLVRISRCVHVGRFQTVTAWRPGKR
jgi:nitroimidazol reductase NimA-like FMN-containing flavoprotein (pyridoxamine 5'-phosphate oxidase superfamily)